MCVYISHLVLEALCDTNDEVVDEGTDGSEGCDILSGTVVQFDVDHIFLWTREVDGEMVEVLCELAYFLSLDSTPPTRTFLSFAYLVALRL